MSPKHLNRYVREFSGRYKLRDMDTLAQMRSVVAGFIGRNLLYRDLIADNGLSSFAPFDLTFRFSWIGCNSALQPVRGSRRCSV